MFSHQAMLICSLLMLITSVVFGAVTVFIPLYAGQLEYGNAGFYLMFQAGVIVLSRYVLRKRVPSDGKWHPRCIFFILLFVAAAAFLLSLSASTGPL